MKIGKYSFGIGDRFAQQGVAQLSAIKKAKDLGIDITPVWNKSFREHSIIGTSPVDTRNEADAAVKALGWTDQYVVDADHINLKTVESYVDTSDFFTLDVADYIGTKADDAAISAFIENNKKYLGQLSIPGIAHSFEVTEASLKGIAGKFLFAIQEAGKIYNYIKSKKGEGNFITEVSMDEVDEAQVPVEMFFILSMIAAENIPAQTIAPKFTGRFNKGVDYVGDTNQFAKEFEEDLMVIDFAVKEFGLPDNLKLSVHSGSDKFSIYPKMGELIKKYNKGLHVKTAGTTWLEEMIGLAMAGGDALEMAKSIYKEAIVDVDKLCAPYATVIDIDKSKLPSSQEVDSWSGEKYANTLRHIPGHPDYNPNFRQLIHVGYKLAANLGEKYINMLNANKEIVGQQVSENIFDRHIKRLFNI